MSIRAFIHRKLGNAAESLEKRGQARRQASRPAFRRYYSAAAIDRLSNDWKFPETTADAEIWQALRILRGRSREFFRNDDYGRRFKNLLKTNVLGHEGIRLQANPMEGSDVLDATAKKKIEWAWSDWCRKGNCIIDESMSLWKTANQVLESWAVDGEILIQLIPGWKNKYRFAIKVIEADHLDLFKNDILPNGNRITMGVEKNSYGKVVAYWLLTRHPGDVYSTQDTVSERYPAEQFLHIFDPERPSQSRGIPLAVSAIKRLRQAGAYEEAELVASRVGASKMGFFIPGEGVEYEGEESDEAGIDLVTSAEPGTFEQLPEGMDFKEFNPQHPNASFEPFMKAILRGAASGFNVSYVALSNNLEGVSFSSIRSGELADRDAWRVLQRFMIEQFYTPIYEAWLAMALTTNALNLPAEKYEKYRQVKWKPRGWKWVDPSKESAAAKNDVQNCFASLYDVAAERGYDLEEIMAENARARDLARDKYGLSLPVFETKTNGKAQQGTSPKAQD